MTERERLIEFLGDIALPGARLESISDDENLVDAGILDSLAVIQIFTYLETDHDLDAASIDPTELMSISGILSATEK